MLRSSFSASLQNSEGDNVLELSALGVSGLWLAASRYAGVSSKVADAISIFCLLVIYLRRRNKSYVEL